VEQIAATRRGGEHVAFPGASHSLHHETRDEAFENFLASVRDFLARQ
jgi:hypothetical protein